MISPTPVPPLSPRVNRRRLLHGSLAVAAAGTFGSGATPVFAVGTGDLPRWSDPGTWGGAAPGPGEVAVVSGPVLLDQDAAVAGLEVAQGGRLVFDPDASRTLRTTGNVVVGGVLEMRPAGADVEHLLRFEGVDEAGFVGGGMEVLDSDTGLWLVQEGQLDLCGTPRTGWVRAVGGLRADDRTVKLAAVPVGWRVGDELVVTPTGSPVDSRHMERFDEVRIDAITGDVVTLSRPLRYAHPAVAVGDGHVLTAEVLNLTRNVRVEGTPTGRMHTMATMVTRPSQVRYAAFRHFGPRQADGPYTAFVPGRYGFHWHMCDDGSRGSLMDGVVMRDGGSHAYVTHLSNGVTHRSCISYDTTESAYWWDRPETPSAGAPPSDDVRYEGCVAALVRAIPEFRGYSMAGFALGSGSGNQAHDCVAVGVLGTTGASGFHWPGGTPDGVWEFSNCVSHNNRMHGIHSWQNTGSPHVVERFVAFHNGGAGISHGAYRNGYHYRDCILYGNRQGGLLVHAVSKETRRLTFDNLLIDAAGQSAAAATFVGHIQDPLRATRIVRSRLRGYTRHGIEITAEGPDNRSSTPDLIDVIGCDFDGPRFWIADAADTRSRIRVTDGRRALRLTHRRSNRGRLRPRWNARVKRIEPFASSRPPAPIELRVLPSAAV